MTDKIKKKPRYIGDDHNDGEYGTYHYYKSMASDTTLSVDDRAKALWEKNQLKLNETLRDDPRHIIRQTWDKWDKDEYIKRIKGMDERRKNLAKIANNQG
tara:strand:- start:18565 stop:18864 length:300 start_codon:yes stop_codon:yes gene_type:complete